MSEANEERKWCAWCGAWGDHQSGWCEDLKRAIKEKEEAQKEEPTP